MSQSYFRFKQFTINQHRSAMKVSTDAVLFGAWCDVASESDVLDIGAGTGILSLMCAQRSSARICAIEPDQGSYCDARDNIEASPWAGRMEVVNTTLQDFAEATTRRFTHIISNPPYFSSSLECQDESRTRARHNVSLNFEQLSRLSHQLLCENGRLSVIIPVCGEAEFMSSALEYFSLESRVEVRSKPSVSVQRLLLCFSKAAVVQTEVGEICVSATDKSGYSQEFIELTREFYLKF